MHIPMFGISGYSGSGKTTLLEKLLPQLQNKGIRTAVIKHTHHDVQTDKSGKDSWRMTQAGASQVLMTCDQRWALFTETQRPASLQELCQQFDPTLTDLILVEGFKTEPIPKILIHRKGLDKALPEIDENTMAIATDMPLSEKVPILNLNQPQTITDFIVEFFAHGNAD